MSAIKTYHVIGGVYLDTDWMHLVNPMKLEVYGPFDTYEEAYDVWRAQTFKRVDECCHRLQIATTFAFS